VFDLLVGDVLFVGYGDILAVDGILIEGNSIRWLIPTPRTSQMTHPSCFQGAVHNCGTRILERHPTPWFLLCSTTTTTYSVVPAMFKYTRSLAHLLWPCDDDHSL
jgi:hypothetical protein